MKRLLRGNTSTSTSPTQSHHSTLPIPTKASVETRSMSESSSTGSTNQLPCLSSLKAGLTFHTHVVRPQVVNLSVFILDQYGSIWSGGLSSSYSYSTSPNNLSATSTLYQPGQESIADVPLLHLTSPVPVRVVSYKEAEKYFLPGQWKFFFK